MFLLALLTFACGPSDPLDKPVITSGTEYRETLAQAERLSLEHLKDADAGKELGEAAKDDLRKAAVLFDSLSDFNTTNIAPYVGAGKIYQVLGNHDAAISRLEQGLATVPDKAIAAVSDTAIEAHYLLSISLFAKQDYKGALEHINDAIEKFPASPIYLAQRASILIQLKQFDDANTDLMEALKLDPNHERSQSLLKFLLRVASDAAKRTAIEKLNAKDYSGVVAAASKGLDMVPEHAQLLALRSAAYLELGKRHLAKADLDKLVQIDPDNGDAKTLRARLK